MKFTLEHTDNYSKARAGVIFTEHGEIETPAFMPVGTLGSVKGVHLTSTDTFFNICNILNNRVM